MISLFSAASEIGGSKKKKILFVHSRRSFLQKSHVLSGSFAELYGHILSGSSDISYGVARVSKIDKSIGLFCRIMSLL